jgi:hypothetical protein
LSRLISHCGASFDIGHLEQHTETFSWIGAAGQFSCSVKIRYSSHCWSFEHDGTPQAIGSYIFRDRNQDRVFCPVRFSHSLELPAIFRDLCAKPTHPIWLTPEDNWTIYRLAMASPLLPNEQFWIFFRLKLIEGDAGKPSEVSLYVESAYPRLGRPITLSRSMFGRVVENL